jgi:hypothetical protein
MEGRKLLNAAEIIVKAEGQIDALIETLDIKLRDELEKRYSRVVSSEKGDDWLWFRNYALTEKGRKKASRHLAFQVVLYDEDEKAIEGWEPSLYVMCGESKEPFSIDDNFWLSEAPDNYSDIKYDGRLLRWEETDDIDAGWGFVLPLVKLNSEKALVEQIVEPVKKLLEDISPTDPFLNSVAFRFTKGNDSINILV